MSQRQALTGYQICWCLDVRLASLKDSAKHTPVYEVQCMVPCYSGLDKLRHDLTT
jgi:hypothetical protein